MRTNAGVQIVRKSIVGVILVLLCAGSASPTQSLSLDEVKADLRFFARFLEETHPDPYRAFGGRVGFQIEIRAMLEGLTGTSFTDREVYDLVRSFLARMGDGHSYVQAPRSSADDRPNAYLPVRFRVADDEVFIAEAKESHAALIGSRVRGVAGLDLSGLREAAVTVLPRENDFAAVALAMRLVESESQVRRMLPNAGGHVQLRLVDLEGAEFVTSVEYSLSRDERARDDWIGKRWDGIPDAASPIVVAEWAERSAGYLGLRTIMAREAFEIMRLAGRTDLEEHLTLYFRRSLHAERPGDLNEAILRTPSICEASHALLASMKRKGLQTLIVDLRGNGGGWSTIMKPLYYMLHGDRFFGSDPVRYATRFSPGYLRILGTDLATHNEKRGTRYEMGDLLVTGGVVRDAAAARHEWLTALKRESPRCHALLSGLDGRPLYTPRVFVLTDPSTFSAAYDTVYHLSRLGAESVGVSPSQSADTFVEGTPYTLPNSRLEGAISRTAVTYPDVEEKDRALTIDHPVSFEIFRRYGFDLETEIRYALDLIERGPASSSR